MTRRAVIKNKQQPTVLFESGNGKLEVEEAGDSRSTTTVSQRKRKVQMFVIPVYRMNRGSFDVKSASRPVKRGLESPAEDEIDQKRLKIEDQDVKVKMENIKRLKFEDQEVDMKIKMEDIKSESVVKDEIDIKPVKVEIKKSDLDEAIILPPETLAQYLEGLSDIVINPTPPSTTVSRAMLSKEYGASNVGFITQFKADRNPCLVQTGKDRGVIFATPEINPAMPREPGKRGLLCSCRKGMLGSSPWSIFVRVKVGVWSYLGEYEFFHAGVITPEQFTALPQAVQENWAAKLLKAQQWKEYTEMRARIYLRKKKKNITPEAVQAALRSSGALTSGDVLKAFKRGEEAIDIISMQCVGYDHYLAQVLASHSKPKKASKKTSKSRSSGARIPHKRSKRLTVA